MKQWIVLILGLFVLLSAYCEQKSVLVKASNGFDIFLESIYVTVQCAYGKIYVRSEVMSDNTSLVHFPPQVDMNRTEFEKIQSVILKFSSNQSSLIYAFANTTLSNAQADADATKASVEEAFNTTFAWHSTDSLYNYFFNVTYISPAKQNITSYTEWATSQCLVPDAGGLSLTFVPIIQKPNASINIVASKSTGSFDWTYSIEASYSTNLPAGFGNHRLDLLDLLGIDSLVLSPYEDSQYAMPIMLVIYTNESISYVSCEPGLAPLLSRGWTYYSYIPQVLTAFFSYGNETSPVSPLSFTFSGKVISEYTTSICVAAILLVTSITLVIRKQFQKILR
jgi:hypothetical protein